MSCAADVPAPDIRQVTASDLCGGGAVTVTHAGDVISAQACANRYTITRTYKATDVCGNSATCTQVITVDDQTPPSITCPAPVTVSCAADVPVAYADLAALLAAGGTASDNCDTTLTLGLVSDSGLVGGTCGGTVTRVYRVTDDCNNYAECTQVITVADETPPSISCPPNVNATCADCPTDPDVTGWATATDNCDTTVPLSYSDANSGGCPRVITRTWTVTDDCENSASCVQKITCTPPSEVVITDSSLCTFDLIPGNTCKDFRLLFTQDTKNWPKYKLNASNPGQTYFNLSYSMPSGTPVTFVITLPYPYVTQGAQPIHAYKAVDVVSESGRICYLPKDAFHVDSTQVTLANYGAGGLGTKTAISVTLTVPDTGFIYLNIHLDYGLKKSSGYAKGGPSGNDATDGASIPTVLIPDGAGYEFSSAVGPQTTSDWVCSANAFKKLPGAGGLVGTPYTTFDGASGRIPMPGCAAVLKDAKGAILSTGVTDEDGWYFCSGSRYSGRRLA